jgi:hypothetical protein
MATFVKALKRSGPTPAAGLQNQCATCAGPSVKILTTLSDRGDKPVSGGNWQTFLADYGQASAREIMI